MMLKLKIYFTIFVVYEIVAVMLMHFPRVCDVIAGAGFCDEAVFKYFIACFAVPAIVFLIVMWIMEIVHGVRHRHSFLYKAKSAVRGIVSNVKDKVSETVSTQDLEKLIVAALLVGVKKYADKNPKTRRALQDIIGAAEEEYDVRYYDYDDDDSDEDGDSEEYDDVDGDSDDKAREMQTRGKSRSKSKPIQKKNMKKKK